ncbi:hypothetical protein [Streptomyces sp. NBC_00996]|uniref:hypothetical protein n=1 Tax=Streptomyces sp. NBC_00996 TaxID=2903710 RepID=UPI00386C5B26|nr:hypothetical protein OG390_46825 [Streptomyces sp. NBC_00996]
MTERELVAIALATGAADGLTDTGRGAVHDLYAGLREAVRRRLAGAGGNSAGGGYGVRVLDAYESDPDVWRTRLLLVLTGSGVETDEEILAAVREHPARRASPFRRRYLSPRLGVCRPSAMW